MSLRKKAAPAPDTTQHASAAPAATTTQAAAPKAEEPPPAARPVETPAAALEDEPSFMVDEEPPVAGRDGDNDLQGLDLTRDDHDAGAFDGTQELLDGGKRGTVIEHDTGTVAAPPAVRDEHRSLAVHSNTVGGMRQAQEELDQAGYVTDTSFGAFPSFVLNNLGQWICKDWSALPLEKLVALHVIVVQVKRKWLYREKKERDARICYSYDNLPISQNPDAVDSNGNPVSAFIALLEGEGAEWEAKLYYEALAVVVGGEGDGWQDHVEEMILISMSPTSKTKWSGFVLQTKFMKRLMPHQFITRLSRGPSMTAKGQNYYPMAYKFHGKADISSFAAAEGVEIQGDVAD